MPSSLVQSGFALLLSDGERNWPALSEAPSASGVKPAGKADAGASAFFSCVPVNRPALGSLALVGLTLAPVSEEEPEEQAERAKGSAATASRVATRGERRMTVLQRMVLTGECTAGRARPETAGAWGVGPPVEAGGTAR